MARSGNYESNYARGYYFGLDWTINSQDVASNSSNVTATIYIRTSGSGYTINSSQTKNLSININGTVYYGSNTVALGANSRKNLMSQTVTVYHDSDGNKSCWFAGVADVGLTLSGTLYKSFNASGTGYFDKNNLNTPPRWTSDDLRINDSRQNNIVGTNVSVVSIQPPTIVDDQGGTIYYDLYRYVNGQRSQALALGITTTYGWADSGLGQFGEGTEIKYLLQAHDGTYWAGDRWSWWIKKNEMTPATVTNTPWIGYSANNQNHVISWNPASNTIGNNNGVKYEVRCDSVPIYNSGLITATTATITVWNGQGSRPTGNPVIDRADLINFVRNSPTKEGVITFTIRTHHQDFGYHKDTYGYTNVDMRTELPAPVVTIGTTDSKSTAMATVKGNRYLVPRGSSNKLYVSWGAVQDPLGGPIVYDVETSIWDNNDINNVTTTIARNTTATNVLITVPESSIGSANYTITVLAKTNYGPTKSGSASTLLHYHRQPMITIGEMSRKEVSVSIPITTSPNTSIPGIGWSSRSYSGAGTGTITASPQTITITSLLPTNKYSVAITATDDSGLSTGTITETYEISSYIPIMSIREFGLGINAINDGKDGVRLKVDGDILVNKVRTSRSCTSDVYYNYGNGILVQTNLPRANTTRVEVKITGHGGNNIPIDSVMTFLWTNGTVSKASGVTNGTDIPFVVTEKNSKMAFWTKQKTVEQSMKFEITLLNIEFDIKVESVTNSAEPGGADLAYYIYGKQSLKSTFSYGYYGLDGPEANGQTWIRTPEEGLLPFSPGTSSALGTSAWKFWDTWTHRINGFEVGAYWGAVPVITHQGVMDIGKYLDFHDSSNDGYDYSSRLYHHAGVLHVSQPFKAVNNYYLQRANAGREFIFHHSGGDSLCIASKANSESDFNWSNQLEVNSAGAVWGKSFNARTFLLESESRNQEEMKNEEKFFLKKENVLDKICSVPIKSTYSRGADSVGFYADDLEKVFPELVHTEGKYCNEETTEVKLINSIGLISTAWEGIQELTAKSNALEAKITYNPSVSKTRSKLKRSLSRRNKK